MRKNILISLAVSAALAAPLAHADAGDTTIGGTMFVDFTSIGTTQDAPVVPAGAKAPSHTGSIDPSGYGLDVTRAYLIVNHQFDDIWSANLTTDFNLAKYTLTGSGTSTTIDPATGKPISTTDTVSGNAPETQLFIKKAYVQGKFDDMLVLHVGSYDTPWIPYAEGVYGYRFVEKTLIDREGFGNSADWGVNLGGGNGMVNYSASMLNGGGYKNPSRSKAMDFEGRVGFTPIDGLIIGVGYYTGSLGQDTNTNQLAAESTPHTPLAQNTADRTNVLVAWKASGLTVGAEYFTAKNFSTKLIFSNTTDSENGYSVYGSYDFPGTDLSVFARYDDVKPTKDTDSTQEDKYFDGGVAWKANKNITWAFAIKSDKLTDNLKYSSPTNGSITSDSLKTQEIGVWAQIKY